MTFNNFRLILSIGARLFGSYWKNQASFGQVKHILQKYIPLVEMWIKEYRDVVGALYKSWLW
jgi:hypothetical protein